MVEVNNIICTNFPFQKIQKPQYSSQVNQILCSGEISPIIRIMQIKINIIRNLINPKIVAGINKNSLQFLLSLLT